LPGVLIYRTSLLGNIMSRIGKSPIDIPNSVNIGVDGQAVTAKGGLGELSALVNDEIKITQNDNVIVLNPRNNSTAAKKVWGTARTVINNLIIGVSAGFLKKLVIQGVGYRAQLQGKDLVLALGFSHDIKYNVPKGITIECSDQTHISISGIDKQKVGQVAAEIRSYRPPEPYKGKGIRYEDEYVIRKEGKKK
jgi:large subunit ribosomal protein L6